MNHVTPLPVDTDYLVTTLSSLRLADIYLRGADSPHSSMYAAFGNLDELGGLSPLLSRLKEAQTSSPDTFPSYEHVWSAMDIGIRKCRLVTHSTAHERLMWFEGIVDAYLKWTLTEPGLRAVQIMLPEGHVITPATLLSLISDMIAQMIDALEALEKK